MAQETASRPSEIIGVVDEWAAFQFDNAIIALGRWIEAKLEEVDNKGRPKHDIEQLLQDPDEEAPKVSPDHMIALLSSIPGMKVEKRGTPS